MIEYKQLIINWFNENKRDLPWRGTNDPYNIFLSEFIMQQTRIEQGKPYFLRLKTAFPSIEKLASASEEEILFYWQGLGYYSRARHLHASAQMIMNQFHGILPHDYETLKKLKGIGEYTAAAIASIGFNQPVPLMDGNVFRVVSRLFGIKTPIDTTAGKNDIRHALESFFDFEHAGNFNEAMMDFGAMQCTPTHPHCETCPCQSSCQAFITQKTDLYPIKLKQIPIKTRFLNYLILQTSTQPTLTVLSQRTQKDIWKNLYEFPLIETTTLIDDATLAHFDFWKSAALFSTPPHFEKIIRKSQKLTHRQLHVSFTFATLPLNDISLSTSHLLLSITDIQQKPVPIMLKKIIKEWI